MNMFIKRSSAADNVLLFLVSASVSVLGTRFLLDALDYPQIAHGSIHLAHAIYGGALLAIANILLLSFHGKRLRQTAAVIAGFGFGQFIDEVGKFITRNNNYFYQPVPVIIYLSLILLFFLYRYFDHYTPRKPKEIFYDTLEDLEEIAENRLHTAVKKKLEKGLQTLLETANTDYHLFAKGLMDTVNQLVVTPKLAGNKYVQKIRSSWRWLEDFTTERRPVFYFLLCVFLIYILVAVVSTVSFLNIVFTHRYTEIHTRYQVDSRFEFAFILAELTSQAISAANMIQGFLWLVGRRRIKALESFKTGLAINILVTHVFMFYFKQFTIIPELLLTILMFGIVHNMLEEERN